MATLENPALTPAPPALREAAADLRHLLARGYPRERMLAVVGDRWRLAAADRQMLRRGVYAPREAGARWARLLPLAAVAGRAVALDGHNVIITLETALAGGRLVAADDGVVRDIAQRGRHHQPGPRTLAAAELALAALARAGAARALIWLDAPLPKSGELAADLTVLLARLGLAGEARAVRPPENLLRKHPGPVATSDSVLLDQVALPLDLAGQVIARDRLPCRVESLYFA
ncbi:MAG: DUF434 domain-containing protein [Deltaproteobacteria bacterium]|nr:DUF434 domain-containing protein [Deltaproteobacteria bacterium]